MVLFILLRFQYPLFTYLYICWIASSSFSEDFVPLDLVKLSRTDCDHNIKLNLKYINKLTIKLFKVLSYYCRTRFFKPSVANLLQEITFKLRDLSSLTYSCLLMNKILNIYYNNLLRFQLGMAGPGVGK